MPARSLYLGRYERRVADHQGWNQHPAASTTNDGGRSGNVPRRNRNGFLQHGAGRLSLFSVARPEIRDQRQLSSARHGRDWGELAVPPDRRRLLFYRQQWGPRDAPEYFDRKSRSPAEYEQL